MGHMHHIKRIALAIITAPLLFQCATGRIAYNIPENYPETRRVQLKEMCVKGRELYKLHCSQCHGIFTKGKDQVPNFTNTQIDNYSVKFLRGDPKNHAVAIRMAPEQLNQVLTFLNYKKPQNPDSAKLYRKQ